MEPKETKPLWWQQSYIVRLQTSHLRVLRDALHVVRHYDEPKRYTYGICHTVHAAIDKSQHEWVKLRTYDFLCDIWGQDDPLATFGGFDIYGNQCAFVGDLRARYNWTDGRRLRLIDETIQLIEHHLAERSRAD